MGTAFPNRFFVCGNAFTHFFHVFTEQLQAVQCVLHELSCFSEQSSLLQSFTLRLRHPIGRLLKPDCCVGLGGYELQTWNTSDTPSCCSELCSFECTTAL